jgi:hypothetical protein
MTLSGDSDLFLHRPSLPGVMSYTAGQHVRIVHSGATGRVFLKLPLREVYLVQFPGFPVVEKIYNGCDLEPFTADQPIADNELVHHHA